MLATDLDFIINRLTDESRDHCEQAQINREHGLEPSDAYWRGRAQGILDARDILIGISR